MIPHAAAQGTGPVLWIKTPLSQQLNNPGLNLQHNLFLGQMLIQLSYFQLNGGQWVDYSGGLVFGWKLNRSFGWFLEGRYNKYWNREWHDFSVGVNYVIF